MNDQVPLIVRALVTLLRQHQRLRPGGGPPGVTVALDDLVLLVAARTGLAVSREAVRNLVDALVNADILARHPTPERYRATTYSFRAAGADLDSRVDQFLTSYHPRWTSFSAELPRTTALLAQYEALWRDRVGGLPRQPDLLELTLIARLNTTASLEARCRKLAQRQPRR